MRARTMIAVAGLIGVWAIDARAQSVDVRWRPIVPTCHASASVAGVSKPDRGVVFAIDPSGNAWEWDGARWVHLAAGGPRQTLRSRSTGYDPRRDAVVVSGDGVYNGQFGPNTVYTHDFHDGAWHRTDVTEQPSPFLYSGVGMGYHPGLGGVVAIGGYFNFGSPGSSVFSGGVHLWDGERWTALPGIQNYGRSGASVAYDAGRERLVMNGGGSDVFGFDDVQEFIVGQGWSVIVDPFPNSVDRGPLYYDEDVGRVVAFGGYSSGSINLRYEWDGARWTTVPRSAAIPYPAPRSGAYFHSQARDTFTIVNGRQTSDYQRARASTMEFRDGEWRELLPALPAGRWAPGMVWDSVRERALMFSGWVDVSWRGEDANGLWAWDGRLWTRVATGGPAPRGNFGMSFDGRRDKVVVFGGRAPDTNPPLVAETWEWDGTAWARAAVSGPSARTRFAMVYDERRGVTVLFGGTSDARVGLGDTWEYDGVWRRIDVVGPAARFRHTMAYDAVRGVVVLFGGTTNNTDRLGDTWEYDGGAWTRREVPGPEGRTGHAMVYDARLGKTLVMNGWTTRSVEDTWAWDGAAWSLLEAGSAGGNSYSGVAYDAVRRQVVLVGGGYSTQAGQLGPIHDDVLLLGADCPTPRVVAQPEDVRAGRGSDVTLSIGVEPGFAYEYQWRRGSVPRAIEGATGPTLRLEGVSRADAGLYDCVITAAGVGCHTRRVFSAKAMLTVCLADWNGDGFVDMADYGGFVEAFESGDVAADANGDGFLDLFDYGDFVGSFEAGC